MKMSIKVVGVFSVVAAIAGMFLCGASNIWAQQQGGNLKEQIVGTWSLVTSEIPNADGTKSLPYGPDPRGFAVFDPNGYFVMLHMKSDLPKITSNNRGTGTPEENKAIVAGSLGTYGTYTIDEAEGALVMHIEGSTFPNWAGQEQKRPIKITSDELRWTIPAPSVGGASGLNVYKRVK